MNMDQMVLVRLRPYFYPNAFFLKEDVLHTMLHDASERSSLSTHVAHRALSHNVHGPHAGTSRAAKSNTKT